MTIIKCLIGFTIILLYQSIFILGEDGNTGTDDEFKCYQCNGTNLNCTQNIQNLTLMPCSDGQKLCFTRMDKEGRNERGCVKVGDVCEEPSCFNCSDSGCNDQKYPKDRLECHICEGDDCKTSLNNTKLPCEIHNTTTVDKCFTYFDTVDTIRGCKSSKKYELCLQNSEYCIECDKENYCNNGTVKDLKCIKCDNEKDCKRSVPNGKCDINIKNDTICTIDKSIGMDLCYIQLTSNNTVVRGCAHEIKDKKSDGLILCKGENCNKNCIEDFQCPICDERDDPTCSKNDEQISWYKNKCDPYTTVCHTCLNTDGKTIRGCGKPSDKLPNCNFCYKNNCTAQISAARTCYKCDSNDLECSRGGLKIEVCQENFTQCFTKLNPNNYTERGCAKSDEKCDENSDDKCKMCNNNNCNIDVVPVKRRYCYQCDSKTNKNCTEPTDSTLQAYPCPIYNDNDKCYTTYNNDTNAMIRGCISDIDANRKLCNTNEDKCIQCDDNKCNNLPHKKESKLSCIQCNYNDTNCVWEHNKTSAQKCEPLEFWKNETCFTYIDSITNVTRGCKENVSNKNYICDNDKNNNTLEKCIKCNTNGCNNENYGKQTCYRCRSDDPDQRECSKNKLNKIKPSDCRNTVINHNDIGCFTEKYNDVVFRGCLVDLDPETQAKCKNVTYKYCTSCTGINCNNVKVPGGNSPVHSISIMILILSYIFYLII